MPEKRLPAIADRAVWEKITKGRAGIRWDSVVEKTWKDLGRDQEKVLSTEKYGGYKTEEVTERLEETGTETENETENRNRSRNENLRQNRTLKLKLK